MKIKIDLHNKKKTPCLQDDNQSIISKSTNVTNNSNASKNGDKKGFMGFVKNIFKK